MLARRNPEAILALSRPSHRRRIGLLGGSFNPAHDGHREISLRALERLHLDAVWWLVSPGNPLKDPAIYADYEARLHEARAVADHPDIVVSDFEKRHGLQYTVDTLNRVIDVNPNAAFVWLMGADSLAGFHRWKDWRRIAELAPMAVFNRPGYEAAALDGEAGRQLKAFQLAAGSDVDLLTQEPPAWRFYADSDNPVSSTSIRAGLQPSHGEADINHSQTSPDLTAPLGPLAFFLDLHPSLGDFHDDVVAGLSKAEKSLSPKYFYDERGSALFRKITEQPAYYPTKTEKEIFLANAAEIAAAPGADAAVYEYGSGASEKIAWLLNGLDAPAAYVAMDISKDFLIDAASTIARSFAPLPVAAVCADFHGHVRIPDSILPTPRRWVGYFPGSTLGNMAPADAARFLRRAGDTLGPDAQFLLGVDLDKDPDTLNAAYNDPAGITAAFNLNLLTRMRRELDAKIDLEAFVHDAFYNQREQRIEMHLRAVRATQIVLYGQAFEFAEGESLHTENSHKYSIDRLKALFTQTPWKLDTYWTDPKGWFAACLLSNN